jgi:hypothetical protein
MATRAKTQDRRTKNTQIPRTAVLRDGQKVIPKFRLLYRQICSANSREQLLAALLQPEAFLHQPLQAGFVEQIEGEFFVGEHGEGGAFGSGGEF